MLENLQYLSILIEIVIAVLGLFIVFKKKVKYGYGIFLAFAIYIFYDSYSLIGLEVNSDVLHILFFIASLSALFSIGGIFKILNKKR